MRGALVLLGLLVLCSTVGSAGAGASTIATQGTEPTVLSLRYWPKKRFYNNRDRMRVTFTTNDGWRSAARYNWDLNHSAVKPGELGHCAYNARSDVRGQSSGDVPVPARPGTFTVWLIADKSFNKNPSDPPRFCAGHGILRVALKYDDGTVKRLGSWIPFKILRAP